jgi:hypothetical protein
VLSLSLCRTVEVAELFLYEHRDQSNTMNTAAATTITTAVNILLLVTYRLGLIIETQSSKRLKY